LHQQVNTKSNELINIFQFQYLTTKNLRSKLENNHFGIQMFDKPLNFCQTYQKQTKQTKKILPIKTNYFWLQNNRKKCLSELHANQNWTDLQIQPTPSVWGNILYRCYFKPPQLNISAGGEVYGDNHPKMIYTKQKLHKNFLTKPIWKSITPGHCMQNWTRYLKYNTKADQNTIRGWRNATRISSWCCIKMRC